MISWIRHKQGPSERLYQVIYGSKSSNAFSPDAPTARIITTFQPIIIQILQEGDDSCCTILRDIRTNKLPIAPQVDIS